MAACCRPRPSPGPSDRLVDVNDVDDVAAADELLDFGERAGRCDDSLARLVGVVTDGEPQNRQVGQRIFPARSPHVSAYTVVPPTVVAVKLSATHDSISVLPPRPPP